MADLALIKRLGPETKISILAAEARQGQMSTSELSELADLLAADAADRATVTQGALEQLVQQGMPAGRVEDLRKAFAASPGGSASIPTPTSPPAVPTSPEARDALARSTSSQQTRPVPPAFKVPFESKPSGGQPQQPAAPAAPGASKPPRSPAPLRGAAAQILQQGAAAAPPAPPSRSPTVTRPRSSAEPIMRRDTLHFGSELKGLQQETAKRPTVLVADDDNRIRMVFRIKLEQKGFSVVEASDGAEAWKRLQQGGISAVVLDMKMPGLHGLEILSRLSDNKQELPVVVCTAYDRLDDEFVVATYPKLRYLTKPVDAEHLAETLLNLLAEEQGG